MRMPNGFVAAFLAAAVGAGAPVLVAHADAPPVYVAAFGGPGSGASQFEGPVGVDRDPQGNLYVVDKLNHRVQKFDADGHFLLQWGFHSPVHVGGGFSMPFGVAVDAASTVYVVDAYLMNVQKFTSSGQFLLAWGSEGSEPGRFSFPAHAAVDDSGYVYVADGYNCRIQKFRNDGTLVAIFGSRGTGPGQFDNNVSAVAVFGTHVYASDLYGGQIERFDLWGGSPTTLGWPGYENGGLYYPKGIDFDAAGNLYVASSNTHRVIQLSPTGAFLCEWGTPSGFNNPTPGGFTITNDLVVAEMGRIYVLDQGANRVQIFEPAPVPSTATSWGALKGRYR